MRTRNEAVAACLEQPFSYRDCPFHDENFTALRHQENRKIFALVFEREEKIWINLKADPMYAQLWQEIYPSVLPGYHMNKKHWISVILDGRMEDADIRRLIGDSFRLTAPKQKPGRE
jgi:predicted DNA-binding protein (MmcQ/YjbR family)